MTPRQALAFVRRHGVVLESARGPVPSLAETIAGEPLRGSWWSHPRSQEIWKATRALRASREVLVCRLLGGKITYVHRRLWPALVRMAERFPRRHLAQVREEHTPRGHHVTREVAFPEWVPGEVIPQASRITEGDARRELGALLA